MGKHLGRHWPLAMALASLAGPGAAEATDGTLVVNAAWWSLGGIIVAGMLWQQSERRARRMATKRALGDTLAALSNSIDTAILAADTEGQILWINPQAHALLADISGPVPCAIPQTVTFMEATVNGDPVDPVQAALTGPHFQDRILTLYRRDAEGALPLRVQSSVIGDDIAGRQVILVLENLSQGDVNRSTNVESSARLVRDVAHDLNTLLAKLLYAIELARTSEDDGVRDDYLEIARASVDEGRELSDRLKWAARKADP